VLLICHDQQDIGLAFTPVFGKSVRPRSKQRGGGEKRQGRLMNKRASTDFFHVINLLFVSGFFVLGGWIHTVA